MARNSTPASSAQHDSATSDRAAIQAAAEAEAKAAQDRAALIESVTFSEAMGIALKSARWSDVLDAANAIAKAIERNGWEEKTVSAQSRKIGTLAPMAAARLRVAIMSYQLSGHRANPSQTAELAGKLPSLRKLGTLKANEIGFGGIVLPTALGEF